MAWSSSLHLVSPSALSCVFAFMQDGCVLSLSCCLSQLCLLQARALQTSADHASWWHFLALPFGLLHLLCLLYTKQKVPLGFVFFSCGGLVMLFSSMKAHLASGLQGQRRHLLHLRFMWVKNGFVEPIQGFMYFFSQLAADVTRGSRNMKQPFPTAPQQCACCRFLFYFIQPLL